MSGDQSPSNASAVELLRAAYRDTLAVGAWRFTREARRGPEGEAAPTHADGTVDLSSSRAYWTETGEDLPGGKAEGIAERHSFYTRHPTLEDSWMGFDLPEGGEMPSDPFAMLDLLKGVVTAERCEREGDADGRRRFRAVIDTWAALGAPISVSIGGRDRVEFIDAEQLPVDVVLDEEGLVREMEWAIEREGVEYRRESLSLIESGVPFEPPVPN